MFIVYIVHSLQLIAHSSHLTALTPHSLTPQVTAHKASSHLRAHSSQLIALTAHSSQPLIAHSLTGSQVTLTPHSLHSSQVTGLP
jgi:hypothetical protein